MAETPPSSGFPSQFPQSQGIVSNLSVNTQAATEALNNLNKMLDGMMKNYAGGWDKATKDSLAGQERFYKYIGDKDNERRVSLERYKRAAIDSVNDELKATLASIDKKAQAEKTSQDDVKKRKVEAAVEASKQIEKINVDAARKSKQESSVLGQLHSAATAVGNKIGGPIGGLISGVGNLIAAPEIAIPGAIIEALLQMGNTRAAFIKTGAQLSGAGFKLNGGMGQGTSFDQRLFGGPFGALGQALSQDDQRAIIAQMAGSRTMIDQTRGPGGMTGIRGNLGLFANILPDASKEMEIFTDATKNLGMSQKDITGLFVSSRVSAEKLKITQLDAIQTQMDMAKSLRNITNDGAVAASVLNNVGGFFHDIGKSEAETKRMTLGIAQAGAQLSLPQMAGMLSFTKGLSPTGSGMQDALFGAGGIMGKGGTGVFGLMGSFLSKVGAQAKNPMERLFIADSLNKQFNLGIQTQDLPKFFALTNTMMNMKPGSDMAGLEKQFKSLEGKTPQALMASGIQELAAIVDPIKRIENVFTNFWTMLDDRINELINAIHHPFESAAAAGKRQAERSIRHDIQTRH